MEPIEEEKNKNIDFFLFKWIEQSPSFPGTLLVKANSFCLFDIKYG